MSTSELARPPAHPAHAGAAAAGVLDRATPVSSRFLRSELSLVFRRPRNLVILAVLAAAPVLLGVVLKVAGPGNGGGGPAFLSHITNNGLFLAFTALTVMLPLFLPLAVAVASGEAVAGEAATGTLRTLLVVPVSRTRLLAVKYVGILAYALVGVLVVALMGVLVGAALFPSGPVTLLSGSAVPYVDALGRALLVALYVAAMLAGVGALGLFLSTLTEVPLAAMAATAIITVVVEILDAVPQLHAIQPYLFTHQWLAFADLLRTPIDAHAMVTGLLTQAAYVAILATASWARLTTKDISS